MNVHEVVPHLKPCGEIKDREIYRVSIFVIYSWLGMDIYGQ